MKPGCCAIVTALLAVAGLAGAGSRTAPGNGGEPACGMYVLAAQDEKAGTPKATTEGTGILSDLPWEMISDRATPERVVVLVHGLDELGGIWDDLAPALRAQGYTVARFEYPNDDPIGESAAMLAGHLRQLRRSGTTRVDLVCHSMGGLVARDCLTRAGLYGGRGRGHDELPDVERLITLGTPNQGSAWVRYRGVLELRERIARAIETEDWRALNPDDPGERKGGAGTDLLPGSEFLKGLNARTLPKDVAVTVIAATITDGERTGWRDLTKNARLVGAVGEARLATWLAQGEAWMSELGDGVVPLDSTPIVGADDYVVLRANHRSMVKRMGALDGMVRRMEGAEQDGPPPAVPLVIQRLGQDVKKKKD